MKTLIHNLLYISTIALTLISTSCKKDKCELTSCQNESLLNESSCSCYCSLWYYGQTCDKNIKTSYFGIYEGTFTEREKSTEENVTWKVADYGTEMKTFKISIGNNIEWYCLLSSPTEFNVYWDNLDDYSIKGSGTITDVSLEFDGIIHLTEHEKESKTKLSYRGIRAQ